MKKMFQFVCVLFAIVLVSCKPEDDAFIVSGNNEDSGCAVTSIMEYFDFLNTPCDGELMIQSISSEYSEASLTAISSISGNRSPLGLLYNGTKALKDVEYYYSKSSNKSYSNYLSRDFIVDVRQLFGRHFSLDALADNLAVKSMTNTGDSSMYFPQLINVQFENLENGKIVPGTIVNWNLDEKNSNGVVLAVEYNPKTQVDSNISAAHPEALMYAVTVVDNGSYTVTSEDLAYFPDGARANIYIGRAGFHKTQGPDGLTYSISAYSLSSASYLVCH